MKALNMQPDWEVFAKDGATGVGAVREIFADHIVVYFEGFGEQRIVGDQIASVHDGKVLLNVSALPNDVQAAIAKAHEAEDQIVRSRPPVP
ncbi:MAG: hypothetical protein ABI212_15395 [Burkholderiaceae bacterium]